MARDSSRSVVVRARGHRNITATHAKTFELATDAGIGPEASCVIGVGAAADWAALGRLHGLAVMTVSAGGERCEVTARLSPFWSRGHGLVVRRSDFRGDDTLAVDATAAAADMAPPLVAALADPACEIEVTIRVVEPASTVLFTDRLEPRVPDGVRVVGVPFEPVDVGEDAEVLARPGAALAAGAALLGVGGGDMVVLGPLPKGKRARESALDAAVRRAAVVGVVTAGGAVAHEAGRPVASAVFRPGEVAAPVRFGPPQQRLGAEDRVFTVIQGEPSAGDVGPLLRALLAEGVSARTLRDAVGRVPGLDKEWDYDALLRLE